MTLLRFIPCETGVKLSPVAGIAPTAACRPASIEHAMNPRRRARSAARSISAVILSPTIILAAVLLAAIVESSVPAAAQSCQASSDLDDTTRAAITAVGQRDFDLAAKGDTLALRQSAVPSFAADFSGVESSVKERQSDLTGARTTPKVFLLEVEGKDPMPHAEFLCGVFGKNGQTASSATFYLDNLAPGKYAVAIFDATSPKARTDFSVILEQSGTDWKLAGLYLKPEQIAGHDSEWFESRAHDFKSKGQVHNAWLFDLEARSLVAPLSFMSTMATDKLDAESQTMLPADVPANGKTVDLSAAATTYKLSALFPAAVGDDLDLIVKYKLADISNSNQTYASNVAVIKALVAKYPEFKDAFAAVVARAVDPSGRDYGTMLAMKDIK